MFIFINLLNFNLIFKLENKTAQNLASKELFGISSLTKTAQTVYIDESRMV